MAIEFISRILSIYKADTTQHRMAVRELSGDQKKAAQEELKRIEGSNAGVDSQIKKLGKLAIVVGSVGVAAKIAFDSLEFAGRRADLASTANIESMEGLRKATRGLMTETELLTAAADIQQGTYKLSQREMENVTGAMVALAERGNDAAAVTDAFTKALVEGKTEGLKKFGVAIYEGGNRIETHNAILSKAAELAKEFSKSTLDGADKMSQARVSFADATDSLRESIGKTAESLTPMVSGLADVVRLLAETGAAGPLAIGALGAAITGNPAIGALLAFGAAGGFSDVSQAILDPKGYLATQRGATAAGVMQGAAALSAAQRLQRETMGLVPGLDMDADSVSVKSIPQMKKDEAAAAAWRKKLSDLAWKEMTKLTDDLLEREGEGYIKGWAGPSGFESEAGRNADSFVPVAGEMEAFLRNTKEELDEIEFNRVEGTTLIERMVGPVDQFDVYTAAFDGMTSAMTDGYAALVSGSESVGTAIKKSIGNSMLAIGSQLLVEGIKHQVLAIGSLASEDPKGFILHQTAAAKSFAGATAVGAIAASLGAGGGRAGAAPSSGGGYRPSAPSSGYTPPQVEQTVRPVILVGDPFGYDSPRNQQKNAKRITSLAYGDNAVSYG